MMKVTRHFLNWDSPFLRKVACFLIAENISGRVLDMRQLLLVVPGARAGRRLTELLVEISDNHEYALIPPRIITIGNIYRYLDQRYNTTISDIERVFIWRDVLLAFDRDALQNVYPTLPTTGDFSSWYSLAHQIDDLYIELSAEGMTFEDALKACQGFSDFTDENRWQVLVDIHKAYEDILDRVNLIDLPKCHRNFLEGPEVKIDFQIVMVGCADVRNVNKALIRKLDQTILSMVFAPESFSLMFDDLGCLLTDRWLNTDYEISEEDISVVSNPHEQANSALNFLSKFDKEVTTEDIVIGLCDDDLIPYFRESFEAHDLQIRSSVGKKALATSPLTLLNLLLKYTISRLFRDFAALIRHPDFELWYIQKTTKENRKFDYNNIISLLDDFQSEYLPLRVGSELMRNDKRYAPLAELYAEVDDLLKDFINGSKTFFDYWGKVISKLLIDIYGFRALNRTELKDREIIDVCQMIYDTLVKLDKVCEKHKIQIEGWEALQLLLSQLTRQNVSLPQNSNALEMLGWLELSLDDADVLIAVGMNEGRVPEVINADCFLPNKLRKALHLVDNDARFARDIYFIMTMVKSKKRIVFIAGQRDARGEGLMLSRLLLSRDDYKLSKQILRIISNKKTFIPACREMTAREVMKYLPKPDMTGKVIESMRATAFRDYIRCPYRFYLKHVLRLKKVDVQAIEFDARQFGVIMHEVLKIFANSNLKDSTNENEITEYLQDTVDYYYRQHFGSWAYPITLVQVFHIKERLQAFASWQANWRMEGWQIKHAEMAFSEPIDPSAIKIQARIDRIDYHPSLNKWLIIDYKTGDKIKKPANQHQQKGSWIDLQLPIYRHLFLMNKPEAQVGVGYVSLPANKEKTEFYGAEWTEENYQSAENVMSEVLKKVSAYEFWPPNLDNIAFDEFDRIVGMIRPEFVDESFEEGE